MRYHWIDANNYDMNIFLLFDRWVLRYLLSDCDRYAWYDGGGRNYKEDMARALKCYPHVIEFARKKAPECAAFLNEVQTLFQEDFTLEEMREAEVHILQSHETFVVYADPQAMNQVNYIRCWDPKYLHELVDVKDQLVLDVGAGTGRLAFEAARTARRVYASEPCDMLREHMRDRIRNENWKNIRVLDGEVMSLPFEDNTFDIILSGHVVGDFYEEEIAEMTRVVKDGGWLVICNGDDDCRRTSPDNELVKRGFEAFCHETNIGGVVYNYRKRIRK